MPGKKPFLHRFHIWRYKHISNANFIFVLSIIIGLTSGLGAVLIKNITFIIQDFLEGRVVDNYHYWFYFLFPTVGLVLTVLITKYIVRHPISHGVPATLKAISKKKGIMGTYQIFASLPLRGVHRDHLYANHLLKPKIGIFFREKWVLIFLFEWPLF